MRTRSYSVLREKHVLLAWRTRIVAFVIKAMLSALNRLIFDAGKVVPGITDFRRA